MSIASVGAINGIVPPLVVLLWWIPYHARAQTLADGGRPVPAWRQVSYGAGLLVLAVSLSAPVDNLADQLLVAHMAEHLLIGDVAALLIVLGFTGPLLAPALRIRVIGRLRVLTHPVVAVTLWAVNFYLWHLPVFYQAALRHDALHALQHATFLAFGMAMWMALLGPLPKPAWFSNAWQLVYIIVVRLIGTVLANAMVFGGTVFYPYYRPGDAHWHISGLADQIAAGSVMMVEGESADDRFVLLAVPKGRAPSRRAPGAAGLRQLTRHCARRAACRASSRGRTSAGTVGAAHGERSPGEPGDRVNAGQPAATGTT